MNKRYYLAYGSNLNLTQMKHRCPNAEVYGTAVITGYELLFKGSKSGNYLTIEQKTGGMVPVGVFRVSPSDEKALDRYEGFPSFYYKRDMVLTVTKTNGEKEKIHAFVYIMHENRPVGVPAMYYYKTCAEGYEDFGFDKKCLNEAVERSQNNKQGSRICPRCGRTYDDYPAISRISGAEIFPLCGEWEAIDAWLEHKKNNKAV